MKTKNELRTWAKNLRKKLDMNTISLNLCQKLISLKEYKNAKNIMLFYPLMHEVNLLSLLKDKTIHRFCSPLFVLLISLSLITILSSQVLFLCLATLKYFPCKTTYKDFLLKA